MTIQFFLPMVPPTVTHQEKQVAVVNGRPRFYEPAELKVARVKLRDALAPHRPAEPMQGGVGLYVKWCFPRGRHPDGSYRITKPDTVRKDLNKLGFSLNSEKRWVKVIEPISRDGTEIS